LLDPFGYVVIGGAGALATVLTFYLLRFSKKQTERKIITYLEANPEFQSKVKEWFGWK